MQLLEVTLFIVAVVGVIWLGIWKSKKDEAVQASASDYFLAGRGLTWWLVGFSLIAANISTEQFVGMSGSSANWLGMAIASYEWMAAITLVGVAFWFLPRFLKAGLYTIPEFLEYRFGVVARLTMAIPAIITSIRNSGRWNGAGRLKGDVQGHRLASRQGPDLIHQSHSPIPTTGSLFPTAKEPTV
ncbi:MAG: hypothetical protein PSV13_09055 [Lacunisphaera sp.]|nr:hypothetical protein [Lacunisphaera sp.]